jgi:hypothetical protein
MQMHVWIRHIDVNAGEEWRRSSGVQEFRSSGVQEFKAAEQRIELVFQAKTDR